MCLPRPCHRRLAPRPRSAGPGERPAALRDHAHRQEGDNEYSAAKKPAHCLPVCQAKQQQHWSCSVGPATGREGGREGPLSGWLAGCPTCEGVRDVVVVSGDPGHVDGVADDHLHALHLSSSSSAPTHHQHTTPINCTAWPPPPSCCCRPVVPPTWQGLASLYGSDRPRVRMMTVHSSPGRTDDKTDDHPAPHRRQQHQEQAPPQPNERPVPAFRVFTLPDLWPCA